MSVYSAALILFLVMDPLGNIPLFFSILKKINLRRRIFIIIREGIIAFLILALFLFSGKSILHFLQISQQALGLTGGIILFLIAIKMVFPHTDDSTAPRNAPPMIEEPLIVPMAVPMIAGPSSMATVILFASHDPHSIYKWLTALVIATLVSTAILTAAMPLERLISQKLLAASERLMGLILTTIAVQMFLNGLSNYLPLR